MTGQRVGAVGRAKRSGLIVGVVLAVLAAATGSGGAAAQADATPAATAAPGRELLLQATLAQTSDEPASLRLIRITLEPGGRSPLHTHPGVEFGVVETGRLVVQVSGRAVVLPAEAGSEAGSEAVPEGVEVTLGPGDRIAYGAETGMTFRNPGPSTTTLLAATVLPAGPESPPGAAYPGGTPTAADAAGVTSQLLGEGVADRLPSGQSAITLERLTVGAGSGLPGYVGPVLVAVERGGLSGSVMRDGADGAAVDDEAAADDGEADATPAAAETFRLVAGEAIFLADGMAETPPLGGDGEVVLLRLGVVSLADEPEPDEAEADETPTGNETPTSEAADDDGDGAGDVGARVVVAVPEARLRAAPSVDAEVLAGLEQGRVLTVLGPAETDDQRQTWLPVEDAEDPNLSGYVAAELVVAEEDAG